jgi:hypothetical protein
MRTKRGGAYNKLLDYAITFNGIPVIRPQTASELYEKGTTYQNILSYLNKHNYFEIEDTSRVDLHVTHPDGKKMKINMYNPGRQSEEEIEDGDVMKFMLRPEDLTYVRGKSQTRKGGKRKTRRKTRRLSSA